MNSKKQVDQLMSSERPIEEIKLQVPWGHIAAKTWGSPKAARVLVVHGTMDNAGSFDRIIPMLPEDFYYVAVDLPGHGLSSTLPLGTQLDYMSYVLAIRLILDELRWDQCVYLGHSFGSQLGVFLSALCPGRITRLLCLDGCLPYPTDGRLIETMRGMHDIAIQAISAKSSRLYTADEVLYSLKNRRQFALNSDAAKALMERGTTKVGDMYRFNRDFRLRCPMSPLLDIEQFIQLVKNVKIPVLIILSEASWFDSSTGINLKKLIHLAPSNFSIISIHGNHDVHNNSPEVVAPYVCAFLNGSTKSKL